LHHCDPLKQFATNRNTHLHPTAAHTYTYLSAHASARVPRLYFFFLSVVMNSAMSLWSPFWPHGCTSATGSVATILCS